MLIYRANVLFTASWKTGFSHHPRRRQNGITKADREARKSDALLKRNFRAEEPQTKCVTDITESKASDGKLSVSAVFDCFDSGVIGLEMDTNIKAALCVQTLENASKAYPDLRGAIIHSDRGNRYTSQIYRDALCKYGIWQSMNSEGGRCNDNARCESMWAGMKSELLYDRYETEKKKSPFIFGFVKMIVFLKRTMLFNLFRNRSRSFPDCIAILWREVLFQSLFDDNVVIQRHLRKIKKRINCYSNSDRKVV